MKPPVLKNGRRHRTATHRSRKRPLKPRHESNHATLFEHPTQGQPLFPCSLQLFLLSLVFPSARIIARQIGQLLIEILKTKVEVQRNRVLLKECPNRLQLLTFLCLNYRQHSGFTRANAKLSCRFLAIGLKR